MTYEEALLIVNELRGRFESGFSTSDKEVIETLYREALRKEFKRTNCQDCYRDALIEVYNYLKTEKKMKAKCLYVLLAGVIIQDFANGKVYTNANLTDEVAEGYLKRFPKQIKMFQSYPEDWETRCGSATELLNEGLISEIAERMSEGATKKQLREDYKGYQLGEKKLTNKQVEAYLKAASDVVAVAKSGNEEDQDVENTETE